MSSIYDDEAFFQSYLKLRADRENYNDLFEQPKMMELLGNVEGKRILEIGCGYGDTSVRLIKKGAGEVFAFDSSEKMISLAREKNACEGVRYQVMDADRLCDLEGPWDIVYSSLVLHYIEDLCPVFDQIYRLLVPGGLFVFSMEHPIVTAGYTGGKDILDEDGTILAYEMDHYNVPGRRCVNWMGTDVTKFHRSVSQILNLLIQSGLVIEKVEEPIPEECYLMSIQRMRGELCRPSYLMCRCRKG